MLRVTILTVGDEILIGQVVDTNSAWIGKQLSDLGVEIEEIRSIKDDSQSIIEALAAAIPQSDYILMTGGLGPTKDDITKKSIADFLGDEMIFHEPTYEHIVGVLQKFGKSPSTSHKMQAYMPSQAVILYNRMGTAPGMLFTHGKTTIVSMPGVPYEMKAIMTDHILPMVAANITPDFKKYSRTIMTAGEGETTIEDAIEDIVAQFPPQVSIAYLPSLGSVRVRITGKGLPMEALHHLVNSYTETIASRLGDIVYGYDEESLAVALQRLCTSKGLQVATAESCTGGNIAHEITLIPGSSAYFRGGIIAYANEVKVNQLGVAQEVLDTVGAVSKETVEQMARGVIRLLGVDLAVAVSGIAGPDGGSAEKPVGTIWIAVASTMHIHSFLIRASKDRAKNIEYTTNQALNAMRKFINKYDLKK